MSDPTRFLVAFSQALAAMTLYRDGHPARERAIDAAHGLLAELQATHDRPLFTFLGEEVVFGREPLRDLKSWEWSPRLAEAGVQRLEFQDRVSRDEFEEFLEEVLARMNLSAAASSTARQMRRTAIRFGTVGIRGEAPEDGAAMPVASLVYSLGDEAETVRWMHDEVKQENPLPLVEAEAVIRSLSVAMHGDQKLVLPLLRMRDYDEYTTTHAMNVAVLTMALAEHMGLGDRDVRAFGVAGLLHDLGKIRVPLEVLTKPGKLTAAERHLMNQHPVEGARLILESWDHLDLAAVVAYEHHIMIDGGGYPSLHFPRDCHAASRLVHICDVHDALRTDRPYRKAWESGRVLEYIGERAGTEFDADFARAFVDMMQHWEQRAAVALPEAEPAPSTRPAAPGEAGAE